MCLIYIEEKTAQRKIPVVLDFLHHRHKACIASGSPLAQLAQLALRRWLAYLPAPVPCTMQKIFSSRKKWSYDQNNPPIFWSRLCESCEIAYFRQFPWVSIKKSSCFLIENAVACCSVAHSSEKQSLIKSWLPCHQGNKVKWPACFSRWSLVADSKVTVSVDKRHRQAAFQPKLCLSVLNIMPFAPQTAPSGRLLNKTAPVGPANDFINRLFSLIHILGDETTAINWSNYFTTVYE